MADLYTYNMLRGSSTQYIMGHFKNYVALDIPTKNVNMIEEL